MMRLLIILALALSLNCNATITIDSLRNEITKLGVKHPKIVLAQAMLESGWLKCTNCSLDGNNPFGFYYKGKYKSWATWQASVKYYKDWQNRHYKSGDYYAFLEKRGYAEDLLYTSKLKKIVEMLNSYEKQKKAE